MERIRDLLEESPASECELLTEGDRVAIRHRDKTPLHVVQVSSVGDAMFSIDVALRSRTTRATRCAHWPYL
jgi:hypothetical protein